MALVVTIIVLLILAGISIATLTGNNGIINQANRAKENTRGGQVKEYVDLAAMENRMAAYSYGTKKSRSQVIQELQEKGDLKPDEVKELEEINVIKIGDIEVDFSVLGSIGGTLVEMYNQAIEDGCTNADGLCTNENHLHIGDYVDYQNPTTGEYTVNVDVLGIDYAQTYKVSQNQLNWRVMGIDEETRGIKLIAGSPMKKSNTAGNGTDEYEPYLVMYGAASYVNSEQELNNIGNLYTTSLGKGRSVTQKDIDELTGVTTPELIQKYNLDPIMGGKNYGESYSFEGHWTPEMWLAKNQKNITTYASGGGNTPSGETISGTVNGYIYSVNREYEEGAPYVTMTNTRAYDMLFDNTEAYEGKNYWLASLGVNAVDDAAAFGPGMARSEGGVAVAGSYHLFNSYGDEYEDAAAVRPVVALNSNVSKDDVPKIEDKTEENWNYGGGGAS